MAFRNLLLAAALQDWDSFSAHSLVAREVAGALAAGAGSRLSVLTVYRYHDPGPQPGVPVEMAARHREELLAHAESEMQRRLGEYVAPLEEAGLAVTPIARMGNAREEIVRVAEEIDADLLVVGSHSKRTLLAVAVGGTARHVARHAPCPVVLVTGPPRSSREASE